MVTITSRDGTRIAYDQTGSGPALIIVYGAMNTERVAAGAGWPACAAPHRLQL